MAPKVALRRAPATAAPLRATGFNPTAVALGLNLICFKVKNKSIPWNVLNSSTQVMKILVSILFVLMLGWTNIRSQGVIIGDTTGGLPQLFYWLSDTAKGFLLNKLTTAQRNALQNPEEGLQIYNTSTKCLQIYIPNSWRNVVCDCSQPPAQPSSITGPVQLCPNSTGQVYSIASVSGANSYAWTVPAGASIQGPTTTPSIVVDFTSNSGTVTVQAQNGCGNSPIRSLSVLVQAPDSTFSINPNPTGTNYSTQCLPNLTGQGITHAWLFQNGNPGSSSSANPSVQWRGRNLCPAQHNRCPRMFGFHDRQCGGFKLPAIGKQYGNL